MKKELSFSVLGSVRTLGRYGVYDVRALGLMFTPIADMFPSVTSSERECNACFLVTIDKGEETYVVE